MTTTVIAVLFTGMLFGTRMVTIPSVSMANTLEVGDYVFTNRAQVLLGWYGRGDIIVFEDPGNWLNADEISDRPPMAVAVDWATNVDSSAFLIKRVIGVAGDHVTTDESGRVLVNGKPANEPRVTAPSLLPVDVTVPEGSLFVLGDNRANSRDSRYNGLVPVENVVSVAVGVVWPLSHLRVAGRN